VTARQIRDRFQVEVIAPGAVDFPRRTRRDEGAARRAATEEQRRYARKDQARRDQINLKPV
jgi:hypothetical protein